MSSQLILTNPIAPPLPLLRFSVEQYHQLGEIGILTPEDKVEMLEGWIAQKMDQQPIHAFIVAVRAESFQSQLPNTFKLRCQLPITTPRSEPEPDIAIIQGAQEEFRTRHPSGTDCRLIIEVADTSLEKDRAEATIYQDAGVQEYWIVNDEYVERYEFSNRLIQKPEVIPASSQISLECNQTLLTVQLKDIFQ